MQLKEITTQKDFYSLSTVWNSILEKSGSNTIFSTFEWLYTWWKHFGEGKKLFILLAQDENEVIGIAPLMIERKRTLRYVPIKVVSFLGTGISDYADFIIIKERAKIVNLFLKYLQKRRRIWDELDLREIRQDSPNLSAIDQNLKKSGYVSHIHTIGKCMYIKTKGRWDTFYSSFSSKQRNNISRQYKRIIKNSLKHSFSIFRIDTDNKKLLDDLINIHLDRMEKKNKVSILGTEEGSRFYKELINKFESSGLCRLDIMRLNGNLASYTLGFRYGNKYYHWNVGINNKYANYAPGKLLLINILKDCFSSHEIDECDFLRGEENYKYRLTNLYRKNYQLKICNNTFFAKTVFILYNFLHK